LRPHDRDGGFRNDDGAEQVGFDLAAEFVQRPVLDGVDIAIARIVDENVSPPNASTADDIAEAAACGSVTSRDASTTLSPKRGARDVSSSTLRAVATTRCPATSAASVNALPRPLELPVMSQRKVMKEPPVSDREAN
jgi:hypothetical protein